MIRGILKDICMARSRRDFLRSLGLGAAAGAAVHWPPGDIAAAVAPSRARTSDGFIRLDSNENVYGPSPKVAAAISTATGLVNRYPFMKYDEVTERIATFHRVKPEQALFACGSTEILRVAACAYLGAGKQLIQASPTFEAEADYAKALGSKLRAIRQQQGLSLHGVEQKSGGRWKAVVVGSYERGDRAVTVQKLAELADFYGVPVAELLPEGRVPSGAEPATKIVINLERLQQLPADKVGPLARYAAAIQSQRGDYNGKVLSIRTEDLRSLAIIYDMTPGELTEQLIDWGVLPPEARPVRED